MNTEDEFKKIIEMLVETLEIHKSMLDKNNEDINLICGALNRLSARNDQLIQTIMRHETVEIN